MRKNHQVDNAEISAFNKMREQLVGRELKREECRAILVELGYSKNEKWLAAITHGVNPPIVRVKRGVFVFNGKPVFKDRLQTAWNRYTETTNVSRNVKSCTISQAIMVLKEAGYKIYKPVTQFEEV